MRPHYHHPFDASPARARGGRWNPPGSFDTLYLNRDLDTARRQVRRALEGRYATVTDLADDAYELVGCRLPDQQRGLDVHTDAGVAAAGLPVTYPVDAKGVRVPHETCQPIGKQAHDSGLDGVDCRSAATLDGAGRELAWWPRGRQLEASSGGRRVPYGQWRDPQVTDVGALLG